MNIFPGFVQRLFPLHPSGCDPLLWLPARIPVALCIFNPQDSAVSFLFFSSQAAIFPCRCIFTSVKTFWSQFTYKILGKIRLYCKKFGLAFASTAGSNRKAETLSSLL